MINKLTPTRFSEEIEKLVAAGNIEYIDAVIHYCSINNIELEHAASLIKSSSKIKSRIQGEGELLNMIEKNDDKLQF